jgi:hypothetical protein
MRPAERHKVLALSHGDGHLEFFCGDAVEVRVVRVPTSRTAEGERLADDIVERMLPPLWRPLLCGTPRYTASTLPLSPTALRRAVDTADALRVLNSLTAPPAKLARRVGT